MIREKEDLKAFQKMKRENYVELEEAVMQCEQALKSLDQVVMQQEQVGTQEYVCEE